ncbi:MAG: hypothetical protein O7F69_14790 [Alphaproteobacteria bacterium]|nr:hypothetical protein [Alphaproteobacteria bacterium]
MTTLYKVSSGELVPVERKSLASEETLENWIAKDPNIIGLDVLILGRQVVTDFNARIDILAIDREGDITVIELKRDRTPREVVAQILDYASWVAGLTTKRIHEIAIDKLGSRLDEVFLERFDTPLPETLNGSHSMLIVASEFDASSKRIVEYLAQEHGVSINTAFFNVFEENGQQLLATDWLMDQQEVVDRAEGKKKAPWTGLFYVNAGHDPDVRDWEDMRRYGFISAGYGQIYSGRLNQLSEGNSIYVYQKGAGYIGYGTVTSTAVMSKDFVLLDEKHLSEVELRQPFVLHDPDDTEISDYVVGVKWHRTFPITEAQTFTGVFANQNIVCKLRHLATIEFLKRTFGAEGS